MKKILNFFRILFNFLNFFFIVPEKNHLESEKGRTSHSSKVHPFLSLNGKSIFRETLKRNQITNPDIF